MGTIKISSQTQIPVRVPIAIVFLCISFVILIWAGLLYDRKRSEDLALEQGRKDVSNLAIAFRENITGIITAIDSLMVTIDADHANHPDDYSIPQLVKNSPLLKGLALQVSLLGPDGIVRASNLPFEGMVDLSGRPHFRYHLDPLAAQPYISVPVVGRVSGKWSVQVTRRLTRDNGRFDGVVVVSIDPFYLSKFFDQVSLGKNGNAALVGRDGIVRAGYALKNQELGQDLTGSALFSNLQRAKEGSYIAVGKLNGLQSVVGYAALQAYPLIVAVAEPTDDILTTVRRQNGTYLVVGGIATIALLALAWLLVRDSKRRRQQELARFSNSLIQEQKVRLDAALENMSQGLVMFDSSNRLVICNRRYLEMYDLSPDAVRPGRTLEEILDCRIAAGHFFSHDREQYLASILASVAKNAAFSKLANLPDGRFIQIVNHPVKDGGWVATHEDVTEKMRREESFRLLFVGNPVPMWVVDRETLCFLAVNEAAVKHYGYSSEQFMSMTALDLRPAQEREAFTNIIKNALDELADNIWQHTRADGTIIDVIVSSRALSYAGHDARLAAIHDITERKRAEDELHRTNNEFARQNVRFEAALNNMAQGLLMFDPDGSLVASNRRFAELFEVPWEQWNARALGMTVPQTMQLGHELNKIVTEKNLSEIIAAMNDTMNDHTARSVVIERTNGRVFDASMAPKPNGGFVVTFDDITERRSYDERMSYMAHYDTLTDLPNRASFDESLKTTLDRVKDTGKRFAILSIDLDHFKEANDTYGHTVGDGLLREIAGRMKTAAGEAFVARLGGDEFAIIGAEGEQPAGAAVLAEGLLATLGEDLEVGGHRLKLGMSIGIAIYPIDGDDADTLMICADSALYRAKAETRGMAMFFEPEMSARLRERYSLQEDLRSAINNGELLLHYQPQVKISGEAVAFEALARWQCPKRGVVPPGVFIPIAEESSLIISLGEWVLREACREAASWPKPLTVAVNVSAVQFCYGNLSMLVHSILLETGLAPGRLELEITETVMVNDFSRAVSILNQLKSLGVRIAMDDFGTGYSSLSYLRSFCCDKIKIDRTFVCDLEQNRHSRSIVRAVIGLGRSLNLPILAEGVETEAQYAFLAQEGCEEIQGYLTGRPLPIVDYAKLVGREVIGSVSRWPADCDAGQPYSAVGIRRSAV
jgi:diguanylate cyclase (GGDEF)-like protein/PAS domain S-box-containing protein